MPDSADAGQDVLELHVRYETPTRFRDAWEDDLAQGALYIASDAELAADSPVRVTLEFPFAGSEVTLAGRVVARLGPSLAQAGATPGISVTFSDPTPELRARLEEATSLELSAFREPPGSTRRSSRFPAQTWVSLETDDGRFPAETADLSYNGMLALLPGVDLGMGTKLVVRLTQPGRGEELALEGRVRNQALCDHGVMACGIEFTYAMERVDEVERFIDELRGFQHARVLAVVAGSIEETPLETVLETFSSIASAGTVTLRRGEEVGRISYAEGQILGATTGLVSGTKALGRMFGWTDARFEFQAAAEWIDAADPAAPLEPAILAAAVERDELARLDLSGFGSDCAFATNEERVAQVGSTLDEIERDVLHHVTMGFPLAAMLDIVTASDASIYKALASLLDSGAIARR